MAFHAGSTNQTTDWRSWRIVPVGLVGSAWWVFYAILSQGPSLISFSLISPRIAGDLISLAEVSGLSIAQNIRCIVFLKNKLFFDCNFADWISNYSCCICRALVEYTISLLIIKLSVGFQRIAMFLEIKQITIADTKNKCVIESTYLIYFTLRRDR